MSSLVPERARTLRSTSNSSEGHSPAKVSGNGKKAEAPKAPEGTSVRIDAFRNNLSTKESRDTVIVPEIIASERVFLEDYTKNLLEMRKNEALWNSEDASDDRFLFDLLVSNPGELETLRDEALDADIAKRAEAFLNTNAGKTLTALTMQRVAEAEYRIQGLRAEYNYKPFRVEKVLHASRLLNRGDATPLGRLVNRLSRRDDESSKRHTPRRGSKVKGVFDPVLFEQVQNASPLEKQYLEAITGIHVQDLRLNKKKDGVESVGADLEAHLRVASENIATVDRFYKELGVDSKRLGMPEQFIFQDNFTGRMPQSELIVDRKIQEAFDRRLKTVSDKWGQDVSSPCYLKADCGVPTLTRNVANVASARSFAIAFASNPALLPPLTLSPAEIFVAKMEYSARHGGPDPDATGIVPQDMAMAYANFAEEGAPTGSTPDQIGQIRARAFKECLDNYVKGKTQEVSNYFEEVPSSATKATKEAIERRNQQKRHEMARQFREARKDVSMTLSVEEIARLAKTGENRPSDLTEVRTRLDARKKEITDGQSDAIRELTSQSESLISQEAQVKQAQSERVGELISAREQVKAIEDEGVKDFDLKAGGDFEKTISQEIARLDADIRGSGIESQAENIGKAYSEIETASEAVNTTRRELTSKVGDRSLSGDALIAKADKLIEERRRRIGTASSGRKKATGLFAEQEALRDSTSPERVNLQSKHETERHSKLRTQFRAANRRDPNPAEDLLLKDQAQQEARADVSAAVRERLSEISQEVATLQQEIAAFETLENSYESALEKARSAESAIVRPAANEYDLRAADKAYADVIGSGVTVERLRNTGERIESIAEEIDKDPLKSTKYPHFARFSKDQIRAELVRARTEQVVRDKALDKGSDPVAITAYNEIAAASGLTHNGGGKPEISTYYLVTLTADELNTFLNENYSGWGGDKNKLVQAQAEARKRLLSRYKTFIDVKITAQPEVTKETLQNRKTNLEELRTRYKDAKKAVGEKEQAVYEASGEIELDDLAADYLWFVSPPAGVTRISFHDLEGKTDDELVEIAKANGYTPTKGGATPEEQDRNLKSQIQNARVEWFSRKVEQATERSPKDQQDRLAELLHPAVDSSGVSTSPDRVLTSDELLALPLADILSRLTEPIPSGYGWDSSPAYEEGNKRAVELAIAEAKKQRRIRYEVSLQEKLKEFGREKKVIDEKIAELRKKQTEGAPLVDAALTLIDNSSAIYQEAVKIQGSLSTYTNLSPLNRAVDKGYTETEYTLAATEPRSTLEFYNLFFGCSGKGAGKETCFANASKLLPPDRMASILADGLKLPSSGTSPDMATVITELQANEGYMSPADFYRMSRRMIHELGREAGAI